MIPREDGGIGIKYDFKKINTYKLVKKGDYVIHLRSFQGGFAFCPINGVCSPAYIILRPNINLLYYSFLQEYFISSKFIKSLKLVTFGLRDGKSIDVNLWLQTKFKLPSLKEQEKIVKFIDLFHKKIDIAKAKLHTLKKYKKGMIKKILNNLNVAKSEPLSKLCKINTGKLDANEMSENGKYKFFTCSREDYLIDYYAFDCEALLVSGNGEVGLTKYYKGKFNAYQRTYVLYDFKKSAMFIKMCITAQIATVIRRETNKGAMPYIRLTTFNKILIPIIPEIDEIKIKKCLDIVDKKIELQENNLKAILFIKKQLLNSLFI